MAFDYLNKSGQMLTVGIDKNQIHETHIMLIKLL